MDENKPSGSDRIPQLPDVERRYVQTLHEIAAGLLRRRHLDEMLQTILVSAAELAGTPDGFLYLYDADRKDLYIRVGLGHYRQAVGFRMSPGEGLSGRIWQTGQPLLVEDYQCWKGRSESFNRQFGGLRSAFGLPLRAGTETVGVIGLGRYDSSRPFGRQEMQTVARFAELASLALDNVMLQKKLEDELDQRKRIETVLRESEERYRNYFEDDLSGAYISRPDGTLLACNPEFARIFGFSSVKEALGDDLGRIYSGTFSRDRFLGKLKRERRLRRFESTMQRLDGTPVQIVENTWGVFDADGELKEIRGYLIDVSEQRELELQLQQALKMEAVGTLAGGIAHDFNNLLMAIEGNVSLMLHEMPENHPHYRTLTNIQNLIDSGAQLTSHLLGYARKGRYEVKPLDLNKLVKETARAFGRTRKQITLILNLDPKAMVVNADRGQMEQTLLNLFVNASDAMPEGGRLTVETGPLSHHQMRARIYDPQPGDHVLLSVSDTGVGMDAQVVERIFDPFFTTKEMGQGTGLGLASVYGIVKGHGGYIDVASKPGQGTTFFIYLPAVAAPVEGDSLPRVSAEGGEATILLVDDEKIVLEVGEQMLRRLGYRVLSTTRGSEAVDLFQQHRVDLVILDLVMPEMSGSRTFDRIRAIDPNARILLASGYSAESKASEIMTRASCGFLQKPFDLNTLSAKIHEILRESRRP
jgi:PAS domain S-box-containing protein